MRKLLLMIGMAVCLTACTTGGGLNVAYDPTVATERINAAETRYLQVKAAAEVVLPFLAPATQEKVRRAFAVVERAIVAARIANTAAEQIAALQEVEAATDEIAAVAPAPS